MRTLLHRNVKFVAIGLALLALGACGKTSDSVSENPPQNSGITSTPKANISSPAQARPVPKKTIYKYVGTVNSANANYFMSRVADNVDKIIGIQIAVDRGDSDVPGGGDSSYLVYQDQKSGQFSASKTDADGGGIELVVPAIEANFQHGDYVIDGFYMVKAGGVHQGVASFGLEKVDESEILLNQHLKIVVRSVPRKLTPNH